MDREFTNPLLRGTCLAMAGARALSLAAHMRRRRPGWFTLCYHAVARAERLAFERQVQAVVTRTVATTQIGVDATADPRPRICLTFDDAFACLLENVAPVLVERAVPATIFAVSASLGRKPSWDFSPGHPDAGRRLMTARELRGLPGNLFTIGSHTVTHRRLDALSIDDAEREVCDSKASLEDVIGRPVRALAFPHGAYDETTIRLAYDAGYEQLFTIDPCVHPGPLPRGVIGRFNASPLLSALEFRLRIDGAFDWLYYLRKVKRAVLPSG